MFSDNLFVRQIENLAELVRAFRKGSETGERVEKQLEWNTGLSMADFADLPPHAIVPPVNDVWDRRARAEGVADALHALGWTDKARRLLAVVTTWRTEDEMQKEALARKGVEASVWLGRSVDCIRTVPRSLELRSHPWELSAVPETAHYGSTVASSTSVPTTAAMWV